MSFSLGIFLAAFLVLLFAGLPVAWTMAVSSIVWLVASGQTAFLPVLPERIFQGIDVFVLMAIPLFILAGELINESRITDRLISFANVLFGWMPGGLAQVNIGASILFSGITGVALGDIAALGKVFIPSMSRGGYSAAYAAAVTASSSIIGPMVPPSLIVVIYGSMTGVSIGALFAACIVPGLLIGLCQMTLVWFQARKRGHAGVPMDRSPPAVARSARRAFPPLMIPAIILAGILGGVMTPTEAGGLAGFYALLIAVFLYRSLSLAQLVQVLDRSAVFSSQLLIIVGCGAIFTWVMGMENVPSLVETTVRELELQPGVASACPEPHHARAGHVHRPGRGHYPVHPDTRRGGRGGGRRSGSFRDDRNLEPEYRPPDPAARGVPVRSRTNRRLRTGRASARDMAVSAGQPGCPRTRHLCAAAESVAAPAARLLERTDAVPGPSLRSVELIEEARGLRIGERLAHFRRSKGFTLARLSAETGISEATLSRAENGLSPLNAHSLYILAKVLDVDIVSFFRSDTEIFTKGKRTVTRRGKGEVESTQRYDLELLCAELSAKRMVPSLNRVAARTLEEAGGLRAHEGEEFLYVLAGQVEIRTELYAPTRLGTGDSMYFDSNMAHAYLAVGDEPAEILVVVAAVAA